MSVALRGNLEDFGISDVFQLVGQQRKTGVLEFSGRRGRKVQLRFDRGAVVTAAPAESRPQEALGSMLVRCGFLTRDQVDALHAECGPSGQSLARMAVTRNWISEADVERIEDLLTRETIFDVLRWSEGSFDFRTQEVSHNRRHETLLGAEQILMDGLRMVDEWQSFADLVPSEDMVFEKVGSFDDFRNAAGADGPRHVEHADRLLSLVDGRLKVRRIIDLSLLGTFDATRALAALRSAGVIEPLDVDTLQRTQRRPRPRVLPRANVRDWIATLLPLVLLASAAVGIRNRAATSDAPGVYPMAATAFARMRDDYATLRVRHALEAYRFAHGRWPDRLKDLQADGILPLEALASAEGRPYYYAKREDGAVLLAPER